MRGDRKKIRAGELKSRQEGEKKKSNKLLDCKSNFILVKKTTTFCLIVR